MHHRGNSYYYTYSHADSNPWTSSCLVFYVCVCMYVCVRAGEYVVNSTTLMFQATPDGAHSINKYNSLNHNIFVK